MSVLERIKQSLEEDYKLSVSYIESFFDKYNFNFRIKPESKGFVPDVYNLDMVIRCIKPDGEVQAEISQEKAHRRYKVTRPKDYPSRIKRVMKLAFQGMGVELAKIMHPDPDETCWNLLLTYPEGSVFHNEPFFVILSCSAKEVLVEMDLSVLEGLEARYTEPEISVPAPSASDEDHKS